MNIINSIFNYIKIKKINLTIVYKVIIYVMTKMNFQHQPSMSYGPSEIFIIN